jgi:hypothetical protein
MKYRSNIAPVLSGGKALAGCAGNVENPSKIGVFSKTVTLRELQKFVQTQVEPQLFFALIRAGEIFDVTIALVPIDAYLKLVGWEELHELRENGSALVHLLAPEQAGKQ